MTFEPIATETNYKGVKNAEDKEFVLIEKIAKEVDKKNVNELINEINLLKNSSSKTHKGRLIFWQNVLSEIDKM